MTTCSILPSDPGDRKKFPITSGVLDYFPDAIAAVAEVSYQGNQQHNPGQPLHWSRDKSSDHEDCIGRHTLQRGTFDTDGLRHTAKRAWRALAALQLELEAAMKAQVQVPEVYQRALRERRMTDALRSGPSILADEVPF